MYQSEKVFTNQSRPQRAGLFPEHPEFYATFKLLNVNNHTLYSEKLQISVVDLTQIQPATKEDKAHQIDYRASLFTCKDWEELDVCSPDRHGS